MAQVKQVSEAGPAGQLHKLSGSPRMQHPRRTRVPAARRLGGGRRRPSLHVV